MGQGCGLPGCGRDRKIHTVRLARFIIEHDRVQPDFRVKCRGDTFCGSVSWGYISTMRGGTGTAGAASLDLHAVKFRACTTTHKRGRGFTQDRGYKKSPIGGSAIVCLFQDLPENHKVANLAPTDKRICCVSH